MRSPRVLRHLPAVPAACCVSARACRAPLAARSAGLPRLQCRVGYACRLLVRLVARRALPRAPRLLCHIRFC